MPGLDRTGPAGAGAMSGRQQGVCSGNETSGAGFGFGNRVGRVQRRGFGGRGGRGLGWGQQLGLRQNQPVQNVSDEEVLENEVNYLSNRLEGLKNQLQEMRKGKDE